MRHQSPKRWGLARMAAPAVKRMTVDEFLRWEDGTDTRYQLLDGATVAMAPPAPRHGILAAALAAELRSALRSRRPCLAQSKPASRDRAGGYLLCCRPCGDVRSAATRRPSDPRSDFDCRDPLARDGGLRPSDQGSGLSPHRKRAGDPADQFREFSSPKSCAAAASNGSPKSCEDRPNLVTHFCPAHHLDGGTLRGDPCA